MHIIDTHCDVLWKLQQKKRKQEVLDFAHDPDLQANLTRLKMGKVKVQFFAIFVHDQVLAEEKWQDALEQIAIFHEEIIAKHEDIKHIRHWSDIQQLKSNEIAAVLAVEGLGIIANDVKKLQELIHYGVLAVGLTWNQANLCADGVGERRNAGLTSFGQEVIHLLNEEQIMIDLSHASDASFDDIIAQAAYPFVSHSNSRTILGHKRNLTDCQAKALFQKEAPLHLNIYPPFIHGKKARAILPYWKQHLAHFCALGGEDYIGIGADFDGMDMVAKDLAHAGMYENMTKSLLEDYTSKQVEKFTSSNFLRYIRKNFS